MKAAHAIVIVAIAISFAGCAGSVSAPTAVQALSADAKAQLRLSDISADAANGIEMSEADLGLICQKVRSEIELTSPGVLVDNAEPGTALKMKIHFTKFDRGSAMARFMLIGLGQIVIEGNVDLVNEAGATVAQYQVSKQFALGGIAGGTTTVEDVEVGFAKSVAEVVKSKT